jgi:group II intron reverse transcriptase/maturase
VIDENLKTPQDKVKTLQTVLHTKAKAEPAYRFYTLWDKIYRTDVLTAAFWQCRKNKGSHGVDGETFEDIETYGIKTWIGKLQEELQGATYAPQPLRRVWIPKADGRGQRPLSICCIKDRVVQAAVHLILSPIFETDLFPEQYGFRPEMDAKMAIRRVYFHITDFKRESIVDADLQDYFTEIPHGDLIKCISRRIADKKVLYLIKRWLVVSVIEVKDTKKLTTTQAKDSCRGISQGSPLSPLLSNCYLK